MKSDAELEKDVAVEPASDPSLDAEAMGVHVHDGVATPGSHVGT